MSGEKSRSKIAVGLGIWDLNFGATHSKRMAVAVRLETESDGLWNWSRAETKVRLLCLQESL